MSFEFEFKNEKKILLSNVRYLLLIIIIYY